MYLIKLNQFSKLKKKNRNKFNRENKKHWRELKSRQRNRGKNNY
jgi:hypothetical protein